MKIFKTMAALAVAGAVLCSAAVPAMAKNMKEKKLTGNGKTVKNVILMISDGCGPNQILATDYFMNGKAGTQVYENFPTSLYMSTYSLGGQSTADDSASHYDSSLWDEFQLLKNNPTDSAAAGTAMSTGVKTYDAAIGMDQDLNRLKHLGAYFEEMGRSTGVISSVEFSHATPASFVAHNASRNEYSQIANEMIHDSATDVIMGAGNPMYDDNGKTTEKTSYKYVGGQETWDALVNGTAGSDANGDGKADMWKLIQSKEEFEALQTGTTPERVIGVPQVRTTLQQGRSGDDKAGAFEVPFNSNVPTLDVMAKGALNVLDNNKNGFFLMIEGGAIDWAGHANQGGRLIEEQNDFNRTVDAVCQWVEKNSNWGETLLIVTGDHETGYLTGSEGSYSEVVNNGKGVMPVMAWNSDNHTNQLIPFFAKGKGAELFKKLADEKDSVRGNYLDNTEISEAIKALLH